MKDYQRKQWQIIVANAKLGLRSMYPQIEDAEILALEEYLSKMRSFIDYIAKDYTELSYEKVKLQRDDYVRMAQELLKDLEQE